ncbi:RHS repeat protein [Pseudidiomarina sp. 1APR75-33.1]|uniref:hypothetical protein n=1 Tax=Pseudidiomarina terrestris TaxID=2820060 RepID=UPI00264BD310|nr:hypothetical protein [Pseudidiomarina sp. 1APR75-33.1]MDN7127090.1 RHS repeat protein [Pseudidiomarina sp. 1APR75-33.1]
MLQRTQTHHSSGLLKRESWNAPNRFVEFNNYVRGIPTSITLPQRYGSGTVSASQTVNARGEVTAVTNFNSATTQYSYDVLGRVTSITPPSPWLATTISYTDENGYLVQTQTRGNYQKRIEHDALLRPALTHEQDLSTQINRYVRQRFDAYNQPTFVSYPSRTTSLSAGHTTSYDGLQRVRQVRNTATNQGTSYTYLSGNRVRETNARGYSTTTTYRGFGAPEQKLATVISAPEGVTTTLSYNLFDQPVSNSQGGTTEYRRYDAQQRLCKVVRDDVGATAYYYNAVGDLLWHAPGANGSTASCDASSVYSTRKISYTYDNVGNVRQQSFPDATPTRQYTFDAQGQLTQLTAGNAVWSYWYNTLGLLESEQLSIDGLQFLTDYGYNTAGHRVSTIYPSGRVVSYAPNAYGEPTQAGSYATNGSYYANGILLGYDTANWLTFWQTLDSQQRLKKREMFGNSHVVNLSYTYDANHNIQSIIDGVNGTHSVTGLSYDGLDRLVAATGHWGQGSFSYDSNGNIITRQLGSASGTYHYDNAKRLTHISGSTARNFSYDNRGNVISNGQRSFSFNRAGQISGSGGITYRYDGHGRRVAKTVSGSTT